MRKSFSRVVLCGALSLGVMCVESYLMAAENLMERGEVEMNAQMNAHLVPIADNEHNFETPSLNLETRRLLYLCLTVSCAVGGVSILHAVGILK